MTLPPAPPLPRSPALRIAVVGPCASGKSTLTAALRAAGYEALLERRPHVGERAYLEREKARLAHAREHADLVIDTSELAAEEVRERVLEVLRMKSPRTT